MLPQDPYILLSYVNTRLRDLYPTLEAFCQAEGVDREELVAILGGALFRYDPSLNQFR